MLPAQFPTSDYSFAVLKQPSLKILLVTDALMERARTQQTEPLWYIEVGDENSLQGLVRWLRYRRSEWQSWGDLAVKQGHLALDKLLAQLIEQDPPAERIGFLMRGGETENELVVGEVLAKTEGSAERPYLKHRFASQELRQAFEQWILSGGADEKGHDLLELGLNQGSTSLGERLDEIAQAELKQGSSSAA